MPATDCVTKMTKHGKAVYLPALIVYADSTKKLYVIQFVIKVGGKYD